ncbi:hypothetical protein SAMN05444673_2556 [Bacillus sp. OV166]|uniref:hypothetical protein n=1 Tax=Bacillus sp. OV166 TaxID=1882763 RepID=UPI000A2AE9DE|nr:hypothetical protein [Bacillus sp. OV166]SMQ75898.1 hypothetical protein SAMN05444673_2556 [Bacillus sp. OV166]
MTFDFEAIKNKYLNDNGSKIFVGNANEIRSLILSYEEQQKALEEMSKELRVANGMIKELKAERRLEQKKTPYDDLDD